MSFGNWLDKVFRIAPKDKVPLPVGVKANPGVTVEGRVRLPPDFYSFKPPAKKENHSPLSVLERNIENGFAALKHVAKAIDPFARESNGAQTSPWARPDESKMTIYESLISRKPLTPRDSHSQHLEYVAGNVKVASPAVPANRDEIVAGVGSDDATKAEKDIALKGNDRVDVSGNVTPSGEPITSVLASSYPTGARPFQRVTNEAVLNPFVYKDIIS